MGKTTFTVPESLDLAETLEFSRDVAAVERDDEFVFDFSKNANIEPFPMLLLASDIRLLMRRFPESRVACSNYRQMTYAANMGFFQSFGLDYGKAPGKAKGGVRYIPVTIFDREILDREAAIKGVEIHEELEAQSKRMAVLLCGEHEGSVFDTLTYAVREIVRNVIEHSKSPRFGICAQYWPNRKRVEVAILDRGIGLRASLANNPHLDASDDKRAINYALMPAVSGTAFKGASNRTKGPWANSGFGLYMTSRICRNGGNFFVASGESGMLLTTKAEGKRYFACNFGGTAIRMVLRTDPMANLKESLDIYRSEGYAIQQRYKEIVNIDPSSASLMLSEDFDLSVWEKVLKKLKGNT